MLLEKKTNLHSSVGMLLCGPLIWTLETIREKTCRDIKMMLFFNKIVKLPTKFNTDICTGRWKKVMRCKVSRKTQATYERDLWLVSYKMQEPGDKLCQIEWKVLSSTKLHNIVFKEIGSRGNSSR